MTDRDATILIRDLADVLGIDAAADAGNNLAGAIYDIEATGTCDAVCLRTLKRVEAQLHRAAVAIKSAETVQAGSTR
jgi:hypothetical protein